MLRIFCNTNIHSNSKFDSLSFQNIVWPKCLFFLLDLEKYFCLASYCRINLGRIRDFFCTSWIRHAMHLESSYPDSISFSKPLRGANNNSPELHRNHMNGLVVSKVEVGELWISYRIEVSVIHWFIFHSNVRDSTFSFIQFFRKQITFEKHCN